MLLILFFILLLAVGIFMVKISGYEYDGIYITGWFLIVINSIAFVICIIIVSCVHLSPDLDVENLSTKYDELQCQIETMESSSEDVVEGLSRIDVIHETYKWDRSVRSYKYWASNPWTNWFHSKKVADSLQYIYYDEE